MSAREKMRADFLLRNNGLVERVILRQVTDPLALLEALDALKEDGWVVVSEDRPPYLFDLCPLLLPALRPRGITRVETPVFELPEHGKSYAVKAHRVPGEFPATDLPEQMAREPLISTLLQHCREHWLTHVFSITVARLSLFGYLPPDARLYLRAASVPEEREKVYPPNAFQRLISHE